MGDVVEATINYLGVDCAGKPIFYGRQRELNNLPLDPYQVRIEDVRPLERELSLDREGFVLTRRASEVADFFDVRVFAFF